jgi:hypothetical protein
LYEYHKKHFQGDHRKGLGVCGQSFGFSRQAAEQAIIVISIFKYELDELRWQGLSRGGLSEDATTKWERKHLVLWLTKFWVEKMLNLLDLLGFLSGSRNRASALVFPQQRSRRQNITRLCIKDQKQHNQRTAFSPEQLHVDHNVDRFRTFAFYQRDAASTFFRRRAVDGRLPSKYQLWLR